MIMRPEEYLKKQVALSTPPKLSLYSLPSNSKAPPPDDHDHGVTPPVNSLAMIPFLWEEAPGKPRPTFTSTPNSKSTVVRSLDLPPRLTTTTTVGTTNSSTVGIEIIPSPTTVLSGPYNNEGSKDRSPVVSSSSSKSNGKMMRMPLRKLMRKDRSPPVKFSSWRWAEPEDSFKVKDIDTSSSALERSPSLKFCSWRWGDSFRDTHTMTATAASSFDDGDNKIGNHVTRRNDSFTFADASNTSRFLANMYGTFKKAMPPWRSSSRRSQR